MVPTEVERKGIVLYTGLCTGFNGLWSLLVELVIGRNKH